MAETVLNQQEANPEQSTNHSPKNIYSKRIIGIVLSIVMIALTVYVLNLQSQNNTVLSRSMDISLSANEHAAKNYMTYVVKYKETKIELEETTRKLEVVKDQLNQVSAELAATKTVLSQTQGMLAAAQEEDTTLKQQLQGLDQLRTAENVQNIDQLQTKIKSLRDRDSQISLQLADLKNQLRVYEVEFSNPAEGRAMILLFQNKIRMVKQRMRLLNQEAYNARIAAQKEKDRLALLNGNSGFVVRNGKVQNPNGTKKTFAIDVKIVQ